MLSCREVDNRNLAGIRHVDEYPAGRCIELKRFRVCRELDVTDFRSFPGIDDRQPAAAVADEKVACSGIDSDIVGVTAKREVAGGRKILAAEKPHRTIAGAGDDHEIRFLSIGYTLRLVELGDLLDAVAAREIHDIEATVAERRHQQPLAGEVDGHVIDPPGDPGQRDLAFERQGFFGSCGSRREQ